MMKIYMEERNHISDVVTLAPVLGIVAMLYGDITDNTVSQTSGAILALAGAGYNAGYFLRGRNYNEITPPEGQEVVIEFHKDKEPTFYLEPKATA